MYELDGNNDFSEQLWFEDEQSIIRSQSEVSGVLAEQLWDITTRGFAKINSESIFRQDMTHTEFEVDMRRPETLKLILFEKASDGSEGRPIGYSTTHTQPDFVGWANRDVLGEVFANEIATSSFLYVGDVVVDPDYMDAVQSSRFFQTFAHFVTKWADDHEQPLSVGIDYAKFNSRKLPAMLRWSFKQAGLVHHDVQEITRHEHYRIFGLSPVSPSSDDAWKPAHIHWYELQTASQEHPMLGDTLTQDRFNELHQQPETALLGQGPYTLVLERQLNPESGFTPSFLDSADEHTAVLHGLPTLFSYNENAWHEAVAELVAALEGRIDLLVSVDQRYSNTTRGSDMVGRLIEILSGHSGDLEANLIDYQVFSRVLETR